MIFLKDLLLGSTPFIKSISKDKFHIQSKSLNRTCGIKFCLKPRDMGMAVPRLGASPSTLARLLSSRHKIWEVPRCNYKYPAGITTGMMPATISPSCFLEPCSGISLNLQSDEAEWVLFLFSCGWGGEKNISQAIELFWGWESDFEEVWMFSELNIHPFKDSNNCWKVLASRLNSSLLQCLHTKSWWKRLITLECGVKPRA